MFTITAIITLFILVILYGYEVWHYSISKEIWSEQIRKHFIISDFKTKYKTPFLILLLEVGLPPIKIKAMINY
jgi:hypothetical protein